MRDAFLVARATARVLADSTRTNEIHLVEELTGRGRYRGFVEALRGDPEAAALLADQPELRSDQVDYPALRELGADTLGGAYVRHLDGNGITADYQAAPTTEIDDRDVAYLMRRFRQTHDVWHALLGLGIAGHEEVIIHAFTWAQLHLPVSAMVVFFGSIKHILLKRRWGALRYDLGEAYRIGRDAAPLLGVRWEAMWSEPIAAVRTRYRVRTVYA